MLKKIVGFAFLFIAGVWRFIWDGIKGKLFDAGAQMTSPMIGTITLDQLMTWGPTIGFPLLGGLLFFWSWRATHDAKEPYLSDAIVVDGVRNNSLEYRARFRRGGSDAIFFVEYGWQSSSGPQRKKVKAFELKRFMPGDVVSFPKFTHSEIDKKILWRFGLQEREDQTRNTLQQESRFPCRATLLTQDNILQHCYFTYWMEDGRPRVLGEHMFSHMFEWEGKTPPNGNHRSLFK